MEGMGERVEKEGIAGWVVWTSKLSGQGVVDGEFKKMSIFHSC